MRNTLKKLFSSNRAKLPSRIVTSTIKGEQAAAYLKALMVYIQPMESEDMMLTAQRNKDGTWKVSAIYHECVGIFSFKPLEHLRVECTIEDQVDKRHMLELLARFEEAGHGTPLEQIPAPSKQPLSSRFANACLNQCHIATVLQNPVHMHSLRPNLFAAIRMRKIKQSQKNKT